MIFGVGITNPTGESCEGKDCLDKLRTLSDWQKPPEVTNMNWVDSLNISAGGASLFFEGSSSTLVPSSSSKRFVCELDCSSIGNTHQKLS